VLNELGRHVPRLSVLLRTTVPGSFFQDRLTVPWSLQAVQQDIGCVQKGPLDIDVSATWEAYGSFHASWETRVEAEVTSMCAAAPSLVLADTPYLALSAGKRAGIPAVVLANFTWGDILPSLDESPHEHQVLLQSVLNAYAEAETGLRVAPGLRLSGVRKVVDVGAIAEPAQSQREQLRLRLGMSEPERLVLVGFGGIRLESFPWHEMEKMRGFRFLVDGIPPRESSRVYSLAALPFTFKTALASVDLVITKPGYGTILEALALGLPVVYVRRYNFADEGPLVEFLHAHGQGLELSRQDFLSGRWKPTLEAVGSRKRPMVPISGAAEAAEVLAQYFQ